MDKFLIFVIISFVISITSADTEESDDEVWARSEYENDTSIRSFNITWSEDDISDLIYRLQNTREVNPPLEGDDIGFTYGFNTKILGRWLKYWAEEYNFKERLALINEYEQYKTNIQGLDIYFLWEKPEVDSSCTVLPLLLLHGFPGSIREFYKAIPLLTTCVNGIAFEVIVPSLPGFGYSDPATRPGLGAAQMGTVFKNLMLRLGFDKFYLQGGDFGSIIASLMATKYPENVLGFHTNFPLLLSPVCLALWTGGSVYPSLVVEKSLENRMYPLLENLKWLVSVTGYLHMQSTKPDTLGVAMSDSPAALLAWVFTLMAESNSDYIYKEDAELEDGRYTRDEMIDNLMMYWIPNKFATAVRLYAETFNLKGVTDELFSTPTPVPTWSLHALRELVYFPPKIMKFKYPVLLNSTVFDNYGHFFAWEQPELFADDVFKAVAAFKSYHEQKDYIRTDL